MTQGSCHFCSLFSNNLCFCLFLLVVILLFFVLMHPFVNFLLYIIIPTYTWCVCCHGSLYYENFPFFVLHLHASVYMFIRRKKQIVTFYCSPRCLTLCIWIQLSYFFFVNKNGASNHAFNCKRLLLTHRMGFVAMGFRWYFYIVVYIFERERVSLKNVDEMLCEAFGRKEAQVSMIMCHIHSTMEEYFSIIEFNMREKVIKIDMGGL